MTEEAKQVVESLRRLADDLESELEGIEESKTPSASDMAWLAHSIAWSIADLTNDWPKGPVPSPEDILDGAGGPPAQIALRIVVKHALSYLEKYAEDEQHRAFALEVAKEWATGNTDFWTEAASIDERAKRTKT